jgi:hypothetical protein
VADQTAAALGAPSGAAPALYIAPGGRAVLRRLAAEVAELAARPVEAGKRELWYRHNALQSARPLVFCDPENGWNEIITPGDLLCTGELAQDWEMRLRKEVFWGAQMRDDRVVEARFVLPYVYAESDWGLHETRVGGESGGAYTWDAPVKSYAADLPRLRFPTVEVDHNSTSRTLALAEETFGDILPVELKGSGGFGWSRELPAAGFAGRARTRDMWGFAESQETVGVSPAMFAEFVFPYQMPILERFGLNCYGCCEPLDRRWHLVERIPRLRRVSVSAWASVPAMAERLGDRYVFSWKPRPADLATGTFDEAAVRAYVRDTLRATRGCVVEVIMKDNNPIGHDPQRVVRWVEIVREEIGAL